MLADQAAGVVFIHTLGVKKLNSIKNYAALKQFVMDF